MAITFVITKPLLHVYKPTPVTPIKIKGGGVNIFRGILSKGVLYHRG